MRYEIWSSVSGNALGDFETEAAALADVASAYRAAGPEYAVGLALLAVTRRGDSRVLADGEALIQRALRAHAAPGEPTPRAKAPRSASA